MKPIVLTKADAARAWVSYQFAQGTAEEVFNRLRSVQFDPLQPVGCNHDLVLQARVEGYKIGDWEKLAYTDRFVYDGWDKMASLVPYEGWAVRRIFHEWQSGMFKRLSKDYGAAVDQVLKELTERGPLAPKDFDFQEHKPEWRGSWFGPNLTKQVLRSLWHSGQVMTHSRRGTNHVYELTERIVPDKYRNEPLLSAKEATKEILIDRHRAVGFIRPVAPFEVWAMQKVAKKAEVIKDLLDSGLLTPIEINGVKANASPEFIASLDSTVDIDRVVFIAPLDQVMWDRKMVNHIFGFEYIWEVYKPEHLRKWGYYVLPVLFRDRFVARVEFWARKGVLEIRAWHWEPGEPNAAFWSAFELALKRFMDYSGTDSVITASGVDSSLAKRLKKFRKG